MREYPNYLLNIHPGVDYFKAFLAGLSYIWSNRKYWEVGKDNLPFDFMSPFIKAYKKKGVDMMRVLYLFLMSPWSAGGQRLPRPVACLI
jgi:hypothetical protein